MENKQQNMGVQQSKSQQVKTTPSRPNDMGSISVTGHLRIFDPRSQETLVEKKE